MRQTGLNPILFIDDVEQINASIIPTLAELIQHTPDKQPSLRLIISGQDLPSELSNVIPVESDESTLKYLPIPPLTEIETTEYIKHRLRASNYPYLEPFNKTQIKKIYLESKGFPGRINHLADQLFARYTAEYEDNKPLIHLNENANKLLKYIAAGLSVLVVIFVVFSLFDSEEPEADLATIEENVQTLGISTIKQTQHTPDNKFSPAGETVLKEISIPPEVKEKPEPLQKKTVNEKIKPGVVASSKTLSPKEVHVSAAEKKPAATKAHVIKKTKSKPLKATVKTIRSSHRWIRKQNPKHFTLQLISGANKAATVKFIKKHKLEKDAATLHSIYKGRDWYSVIYKAFSTKKAARQARNALPRSIRKTKPWIRSFSYIQKSMR
ncbi:MAG TPA: hypothetical protein ENK06_04100 [Gammaproteobacteria bacterium]|nr:hypothetical protein [Gammaproteobacteria bacterium]